MLNPINDIYNQRYKMTSHDVKSNIKYGITFNVITIVESQR